MRHPFEGWTRDLLIMKIREEKIGFDRAWPLESRSTAELQRILREWLQCRPRLVVENA
jgi:hypothetical protein